MKIEISEYTPPPASPVPPRAPPSPPRKNRSALYLTLAGVATFLITLAALNWHVLAHDTRQTAGPVVAQAGHALAPAQSAPSSNASPAAHERMGSTQTAAQKPHPAPPPATARKQPGSVAGKRASVKTPSVLQ
jgi:hypothetical protein